MDDPIREARPGERDALLAVMRLAAGAADGAQAGDASLAIASPAGPAQPGLRRFALEAALAADA